MVGDYASSHAQFAAAFWAQVAAEPVARSYAQALFGAAQNAGLIREVAEQYLSFLEDVLGQFPQFERLLESAFIPFEEKEAILDRTLGSQAVPTFLNFLKVVVRRGRVPLLRDIYREYLRLIELWEGRITVEVTTALPLSPEEEAQVRTTIKQITGKDPKLICRVDPELIGGIVIRIGDKVYDASVATQLQSLTRHIIDRATHEIQHRRDRFRSPAGD